jgi:hypothetical protein
MANKEGKHFHYMDLEFWAQNGMVTVLDSKRAADGRDAADCIFHVSPGEFIKRAIAVRMSTGDQYPDERRRASRFMEEAVIVAKEAKKQGDPSDERVLDHVLKHNKRAQIIVPSMSGGSALAGVDYKVETGKNPRNIVLRGDYEVLPDFKVKSARNIPKRKKRR